MASIDEIIANSSVSDKVKEKFLLINNANLKKVIIGCPVFEPPIPYFKLFNWPALFFNIIYYFVKGMWKKALVLLVIWVSIVVVVSSLGFGNSISPMGMGFVFFVGQMAYYDYYRKEILKEDFWW